MPSNNACVKPAPAASEAASFNCFKCASWSSTIGSQPTHLFSSSAVHRVGSPRQSRAILSLVCQSFSVDCTACVCGAENSQRGNWILVLVLTAGLSFAPQLDGAE